MPNTSATRQKNNRLTEALTPLILVVDDTEATRYALARQISRVGFRVLEAASGNEALQMAKLTQPALITMDIHLPDMLGFEAARKLKSTPETTRIPILHISASFVTSRDRVEGLDGGADGYLTHPVDPEVLVATIRALLRLSKVDDALRESEEKFRILSEALPQMTWISDAQGRPQFINQRWTDFTSKVPSAGDPYFWAEIVHAEDIKSVLQTWQMSLQTGERFETEMRMRSGSGLYRWQIVQALPVRDERGEINKWIGSCTDIDEKKHLEFALLSAKEEAVSANRAKSQFLANMSHEIRTPLGVILGFSEVAIDGSEQPQEQAAALQAIRRNAIYLAALVDDILDLSKIEADRLEIEHMAVSLKKLIDSTFAAVKPKADTKGIDFIIEGRGPLPTEIMTDETRLLQILINLSGNAVKFTANGQVKVEFSVEEASVESSVPYLQVNISDTGIGVPSEQIHRLFQVFSQGDASTNRKFGGSGLGLALSRKLAEALGGGLQLVKSVSGQGSLFRLRLPLKELPPGNRWKTFTEIFQQAGGGGDESQNRHHDFSRLKILVVEDSSDNRNLLARFLSSTHAQVEFAFDGREGIQKAQSTPFDLILMDIQMPEIDGIEAVTAIRKKDSVVPIIALTAHALKGDRELCLTVGCDDYLTKPIHKNRLLEMIERVSAKS